MAGIFAAFRGIQCVLWSSRKGAGEIWVTARQATLTALVPVAAITMLMAVGSSLAVCAQTPAPVPPTAMPPSATATVPTAMVDPQVRILQAQLEQMQRDSARDVAIIQWGFGTIAILAVALLGFNWFSGRRDKEALQAQISDEISQRADRLEKDVADRLEKASGAIAARNEENLKMYSDRIADLNRKNISAMNERLDSMNLSLTEVQAEIAELEHIPSNMLLHSVQAIRIATRTGHTLQIPTYLTRIKDALPRVYRLTPDDTRDLDDVMRLLRDEYPTEIELIRKLAADAQERIAAEARRNSYAP